MRDRKILAAVINDLPAVREILADSFQLQNCGIEVWEEKLETVVGAIQAISRMVEGGVDVALLDASLTDGSGLYVLEAIRKQAPEIKVVGMSSTWPFPQQEGLVVDHDLSGITNVTMTIGIIKKLCQPE